MQRGKRDSIANTFWIATSVCLVCSFFVASAAVGLRSLQKRNVEVDRKKNILAAVGFKPEEINTADKVVSLFESKIEPVLIELATGQPLTEEEAKNVLGFNSVADAIKNYDQIKTAKAKQQETAVKFTERSKDIAGLSWVEKYSHVYLLKDNSGKVTNYIFPIRGRGLWSTLEGFLAINDDFQTISGLTYYKHGETPGLGGEVDNPSWKKKWLGKKIYQDDKVAIKVVKGSADASDPHGVDGLSGATITSNGVSNMLKYWLGPDGFGPYIEKQKGGKQVSRIQSTETGNG